MPGPKAKRRRISEEVRRAEAQTLSQITSLPHLILKFNPCLLCPPAKPRKNNKLKLTNLILCDVLFTADLCIMHSCTNVCENVD